MPTATVTPPVAKPDAAPEVPASLLSHVDVRPYSPSLLVLLATFPRANGVTEHLALATPAAPYGNTPWQSAAIALYLAAVRAGREQLSAAALRDFLHPDRRTQDGQPHPARLPFHGAAAEYPLNVLHDRRIACVLSVVVGGLDENGWPEAELFVWEREEGMRGKSCGFNRTMRRRGAAAVVAFAHEEMEGEYGRLAARVRQLGERAGAVGLAREAELAGLVAKACGGARATARADTEARIEQARQKTQKTGAGKVRKAMRLPLGAPELGEQVEVAPAVEMVTGTVVRPVEFQEVKGHPVARMHISVDQQGPPRSGASLPELLICSLEGTTAQAAHRALRPGSQVVIAGRRRVRTYRGSDNIPRSAVSLQVERIGLDITQI
ncbi:single-stranded DNA-binding protein [Kitasatospora sp. NPDC059146]|uniref:single-stranded DNA-binding protein n=1 Tax=unclassified Kitasatospora TaxID=2633591 RepID=UPI0036AF1FF8